MIRFDNLCSHIENKKCSPYRENNPILTAKDKIFGKICYSKYNILIQCLVLHCDFMYSCEKFVSIRCH